MHYCDHALSVVRPSSLTCHIFDFLWNHWTEFDETWQEGRSQRPLPRLCFSGRSENQDGRPGVWLAETFSTSPLKPLNGTQRNLTGSKISTSFTKFVLLGRSEKQDGRPGLWLAETFSTSPLKPLNGIQRNLTGSKTSTSSTKFVFFGPIGKTRWPSWPLIGWDIFDFSSETAERNSTKFDMKQDLNALYQVCVFRADRKKKMAALASDWLRHFRLLLWNRWTEFNETWQEAISQRPLPSLCFSGRSEKQDGCPGQSAKKVAHCTQVHDMWPFGTLVYVVTLFFWIFLWVYRVGAFVIGLGQISSFFSSSEASQENLHF